MRKIHLALYVLAGTTIGWNCANQTTPTGGPKDETPPKLIRSIPAHKQKNYNGKSITLEFDEYINLNNPKEEILISPAAGKNIQFKARKNVATIQAEDGWSDTTTYTIAIREGIRDITENNAPENLQLAFSTGPTIDSLSIKGKVKFALKETVPDKITVAIYKPDTFDIFEHTPSYFTVVDKTGKFSLENIKDGHYAIYAFNDKNKNLKVESRTETFGFLKDTFSLAQLKDSLVIPLVNIDARELKLNSIRHTDIMTKLKFNKYLNTYTLTHNLPTGLIHSFGDDQSEISIYLPQEIQDSIPVRLFASDSLLLSADTSFYIKKVNGNFIRGDFTLKPEKIKYNLETNQISLQIKTSKPLSHITYDSIYIKNDSAQFIAFQPQEFSYDTTFKILSISKKIVYDSLFRNKKFNPEYRMGKGALISLEQDSSKYNQQTITPLSPEQTGTLLIEAQTTEQYYVIQLFNSSNELIREVRNTKTYTFKFVAPQNYKLRVIKDSNNNGRWDVGNIYKKEEPEGTYFYKTPEGNPTFPVRANWELGPLLLIF